MTKPYFKILKMKMTSNGRRPQVERCAQSVQNMTFEFLGETRGKLRGNLECGSAHPSLFKGCDAKKKCCYVYSTRDIKG